MQQTARAREIPNQRNRRRQKQIQVKIGHGGTLDPMATGVLIAGIGKGTKVLDSFLKCTKAYESVVLFGAATDTYDTTGKILKRGPYEHLTKEVVEEALSAFRGKIMQRPPIYSALKMNGKPLYEYAREGKEIPREIVKRPVECVELELLEWMEGGTHEYKLPTEEASAAEKKVGDAFQTNDIEEITGKQQPQPELAQSKKRKMEDDEDDLVADRPPSKKATVTKEGNEAEMSGGLQERGPPAAKIRMTVTSGFYVRSLAFDLGQALGSQAVMAALVRTRQGKFELGKNALEWEMFKQGEDVWGPHVEGALDDWSESYKPFSEDSQKETLGSTSKSEPEADTKPESTKEDGAADVKAKEEHEAIAEDKDAAPDASADTTMTEEGSVAN